MSVNQQCSRQVIANVILMRELPKVLFRGVLAVIQLAPIVDQKHKIRPALCGSNTSSLPKRLGKSGHFHSVVVEKTPSRLRCCGRRCLTGEQRWPCRISR